MPSLFNTVRDLERLRQIAGVLAVHGFGEVVNRTGLSTLIPGRKSEDAGMPIGIRLRKVLEDLGPSFVKLGQIISTRPDLVPEDIVVELKKLQDEVPPVPFAAVREQVEAELGCPLCDVYESFDEAPLASASIAQVHHARLREDGDPVALMISGAILLSQESYWLGGIAVATGAFYGFAHTAAVWLLGKPPVP